MRLCHQNCTNIYEIKLNNSYSGGRRNMLRILVGFILIIQIATILLLNNVIRTEKYQSEAISQINSSLIMISESYRIIDK